MSAGSNPAGVVMRIFFFFGFLVLGFFGLGEGGERGRRGGGGKGGLSMSSK